MVRDLTDGSFGLIIAYLVPGAAAFAVASEYIPVAKNWFGLGPASPTIGGFLYCTLGSLGAGLTLSAVRWSTLDRLHHATGLPAPALDFAQLQRNYAAFQGAVENHYRYYQFYGNMLIVVLLLAIEPHARSQWLSWPVGAIIATAVAVLYFIASRDTLAKYYRRTNSILSPHFLFPNLENDHDERLASHDEDPGTPPKN